MLTWRGGSTLSDIAKKTTAPIDTIYPNGNPVYMCFAKWINKNIHLAVNFHFKPSTFSIVVQTCNCLSGHEIFFGTINFFKEICNFIMQEIHALARCNWHVTNS